MPFTLTMPKLSPTMETGTLVKWYKKVGEHINAGEVILEIATDKATVEHQMIDSGWLRKILLDEGQEGAVNAPLAIFTEEKDESIEGYTPEGTAPIAQPAEQPKQQPVVPAPPVVEVPAAKVQEVAPKPEPIASLPQAAPSGRILASPLAKKLAHEQGLDISSVTGSGPGGRIMKRDLANAKATPTDRRIKPRFPAGTFDEIPLSQMRKVIAKRLQEAKATIPHFYVRQTINAENLIAVREQLKNVEKSVTFNDLIIKALALALRQHPEINCGFDPLKNTLLSYKTVDISVAVSVEGGLITPIIANADYKSVFEISDEVKELAKKAKSGKLQPHEFQGGSFTLSNMGMYGITDFQAIINPPQAGILAVSGINDAPVVKNGSIVPGKLLNLTLSVDHRAIDGAAAARFIKTLQLYLENSAVILLNDS